MNLNKFISKFGLYNGLILYFKFRYGKTTELRLPNIEHEFYMKPNSIDNASFEEIFLNGEYEINYPEFKTPNLNIIDAGANIGFSSIFYANRFFNSNILAIEPESENFKSLLKNTCKYDNIKPINGAVWKNDCFIEIIDKGWGTRGFMIKEIEAENDNSFKGLSINNFS